MNDARDFVAESARYVDEVLSEINLREQAYAGQLLFVVTAGTPIDIASSEIVYQEKSSTAIEQYEQQIDALKLFLDDLVMQGGITTFGNLDSLCEEIKKICSLALCTQEVQRVVDCIATAFANGDSGSEPIYGRCGIVWFMGNRM